MRTPLDPLDAALLGRLQEAVPFVPRPFAALGAPDGLAEVEVIERLRRLKQAGIVRQISAIFDSRRLGYASSLVAARAEPGRVEAAAAVINQHPGVSHNYLRDHEFNLWFTIAVSPASRLGLEGTVGLLQRLAGTGAMRLLPTVRLFKIGVRFDLEGEGRPDARGAATVPGEDQPGGCAPLTAGEQAAVRVLQRDLPLVPTPFVEWAAELGVAFEDLRRLHDGFLAAGRMRRFAAVLHHRRAGFKANAMAVWAGPDDPDGIEHVGRTMAGFRAVSHCYQRPTFPGWPYNLFTMVHGRSVAECETTVAAIAEATGLADFQILYSTKEFKKARVRYFTGEEEAWEQAHASS